MSESKGVITILRAKQENQSNGSIGQISPSTSLKEIINNSSKSKSKVKQVVEISRASLPKPMLSQKRVAKVDMQQFARTPNDSNDPSYTNLTLPYSVVARMRYRYSAAKQKAQFIKELQDHELLQSKALDGCRIHREFCNAILKPVDPDEMIKLTDKQREKIEKILERNDDFYY